MQPKKLHHFNPESKKTKVVGLYMEEIRQIVKQFLDDHCSCGIKELVAKSTVAQSDAKHYQTIYEEL